MEVDSSRDGELPKLKRLAGELLAAEAPDLGILDQIAVLAAEVAAQCREAARLQLVERVARGAAAIFPSAADALRARLTQSSAVELTEIEALLDQLTTARAAFARADADLRTAHRRGDYAAMAPLALDADKQKIALAAAIAGFEERLGLGELFKPELVEIPAAEPPAAEAGAEEGAPTDHLAEHAAEHSADHLAEHAAEHSEDMPVDGDGESRAERPRLRALIRQMRSVPEAAAVRR